MGLGLFFSVGCSITMPPIVPFNTELSTEIKQSKPAVIVTFPSKRFVYREGLWRVLYNETRIDIHSVDGIWVPNDILETHFVEILKNNFNVQGVSVRQKLGEKAWKDRVALFEQTTIDNGLVQSFFPVSVISHSSEHKNALQDLAKEMETDYIFEITISKIMYVLKMWGFSGFGGLSIAVNAKLFRASDEKVLWHNTNLVNFPPGSVAYS